MSEENYGIDVDYNTRLGIQNDDSLTLSLFGYLKYKGISVIKASCPVVRYNDQVVEMSTRLLPNNNDMESTFDDIYQEMTKGKFKTVFLYEIKIRYIFISCGIYDSEFKVITKGEPELKQHGYIRYGVINE